MRLRTVCSAGSETSRQFSMCSERVAARIWTSRPSGSTSRMQRLRRNTRPAILMRQISKPAVRGCGYRQAGGGWSTNKKGDRVKTSLWKYAEDMFCPMTQEQAHEAVHIFRTRYKKVVNLWYDIERAVARCIKTGTTEWLGPTKMV